MDIFKQRFEKYNARDFEEEKTRRLYKEFSKLCVKKCIRVKDEKFTDKERECFKNCSSKVFKHFLPLYENYI